METTPRDPTVTSGPIRGETFVFRQMATLMETSRSRKTIRVYGQLSEMPALRVVISIKLYG